MRPVRRVAELGAFGQNMKYVILEPSSSPRGSKVASAPARKLAESLSDALGSIGKVYYGVEERDGAGWELALSMGGIHYILVLRYTPECQCFYLLYEPSVLSSLIFWWRGFFTAPRLKARIQLWADGHKDIASCTFMSRKELAQFESGRLMPKAEPSAAGKPPGASPSSDDSS